MMSEDTTSQFIASLVKSLQALCHGYVDFQKNIEIIGHIYINVDSQQKFDYIVNEQVCKNDDESPAMFVSNSFHAMPNRKPVRTFLLNDSPLDLKTHAAKDVTGVDLSTFQPDTGQGRSASRESSQSLSAGSEAGSFSGSLRESSLSSSRQNPENYVSRRKRHLNDISSKLSPTVSPPPSRNRDGERREPRDSPSLRSQYTLGASASKLARRISNELEKQALTNPVHHVQSDSEIHSRLASSNHSPSRHGRHDNSVTYHRHYSGDSSKQIDSVKDPPLQQDGQPLDDSIDLTRVKEEVIDEEQLFDQLDWTRAGRETDQEQAFPRTGPDDPATEGRHANQNDQTEGEDLSSASLYPVMIHQNTAGLPGYGSPVFPQNFTESSHTMSAGSSPIPSTSGQLSPGSAFAARRPQPGNSGRGNDEVRYGDFVRPMNFPIGRSSLSGYREKLRQENPVKWMNFMWKERERVKKERAILKEREDEQAQMKKERIRIQNRLRKRKERQRKRERDMLAVLKAEPDGGKYCRPSQFPKFQTDMNSETFSIHPAFHGLPVLPTRCNVNL